MTLRPLNLLLALATFGALAGCTAPADDGKDTGEVEIEACDNAADDDGDGDVDCDDADCVDDAACDTTPTEETDCEDGLDDDADGTVDCDDTDCADAAVCDESPTTETECADGLDDDGDGTLDCLDTDCADDPACTGPSVESNCVDGLDNDKDTTIDCADTDCAADAACAAPSTETNCTDGVDDDADDAVDCDDADCAADAACVGEPVELFCSDTFDNDADGLTDCDDADCAADAACVLPAETNCADALDDDGDGATDCDDSDCDADAACAAAVCGGEGDLGSAIGYGLASGNTYGGGDDFLGSCAYYDVEDVSYTWTAPADGTYLLSSTGSDYDTMLLVLDGTCASELGCDDDSGEGTLSLISFAALAGEELTFVVDGFSTTGNFVLSVLGGSETDCRDGVDEDADGATDCDDSDCTGDATCTPESECEDAIDSDLDGATDCEDSDCADLLLCATPCADGDLGNLVGAAVATGTNVGAGNDYTSDCASESEEYFGEDVSWLWTAPHDGVYTFDTVGSSFDTILGVEEGTCSGTELDCDDDSDDSFSSSVSISLLEGVEVVLHVDGFGPTDLGDYTLNIWSNTEVDCADGGDEDSDGDIDCADSDCTYSGACNELVCNDGADDEGDGGIDCLDEQCEADPVCDPSLADFDLGSVTGTAVATGNTTGTGNELTPSCGYSTSEEVAYSWIAPSAGDWTFETSGSDFDTVLGLYAADGTSIGCDDDADTGATSFAVVSLDAGQLVIIGVDGYAAYTGNYTLSIY